jgi:hypothetical protein
MKIVVDNLLFEEHYRFIPVFPNNYNPGYSLVFMYFEGTPTLICDCGHDTFYDFASHELYEAAIQSLIDQSPNKFTYTTEVDTYNIFEDSYCMYGYDPGYANTISEELALQITNHLELSDNHFGVIKNINYFKEICAYAPCVDFQQCGNCEEYVNFNELFVDTRWCGEANEDNTDPSRCPTCYYAMHDNERAHFTRSDHELINKITTCFFNNDPLTAIL